MEEFADMKEREERKVLLEREEKQKDYQARKMHYLLSTKQVSLPVPGRQLPGATGTPSLTEINQQGG